MKEELVDREALADKKKRLLTIFGVLLSVLLLILLVYYVNCVKPVKQFESYYQERHYQEAYDLYTDTLSRIQSNARKAEQIVRDNTDYWWLKYKSASITRKEMEEALKSSGWYESISDYNKYMTANAEALFASREFYDSGIEYLEAGEWQDAITSFKKVLKDDILYKESQTQIKAAQEGYCQQKMDEADALAEEKEFEAAILLVDQVLKEYPEHDKLKSHKESIYKAYKLYQKETGLRKISEYLEEHRLEDALSILVELQADFPEDEEILTAFADYEALYSQEILAAAQPLYEQAKYEEALAILKPAYQLLPKNQVIAELYDQTAGHLPAWLCEFAYENVSLRGTRKVETETRDVHGNTYQHAIVYTEPSALSMQTMTYAEGKESYDLNGAYTRLLGTLSIKDSSRGIRNNQTGTFRIYSGDEVLFEADELSEESEPVFFSVDITDTDILSFTFESGIGLKYILGDLCVYKTYPEQN